ncbi:hypothetical protein E4631_09630 [Hymenobacter sp. UV11]|uniref:hypothetical protein n=1 Tax=Hymenobacter sp. UV11 TaxID=1849735 RepID=UPI00105B64D3|nr:hypothetical protein [Hymenobacter sp. UV11]TDN39686.1 hypothetical protein A8B98_17055 [Hymenobacter sp. UV11]TFZ67195.1 hypothetical protein E4631_09630 [Hymenobacter sp. UV11]
MKLLSDTLVSNDDFFVEQVHLTAIVFDTTDDVTVWATTFRDEDDYFFHLGLPFQALDTLLRVAGDRAEALAEEVADALATTEQWPCLLEYATEDDPPVPLPGVALKLAVTFPADADETDDPQPHNIFYLEGIYARLAP